MTKPITHRKNSILHAALMAALMVLVLTLSACQSFTPEAPPALPTLVAVQGTKGNSEVTVLPAITPTLPAVTPTAQGYDPSIPGSWMYLPVIPDHVSQRVYDLYEKGKTSGLNQNAFSKVGDCETSTQYFLAPFDMSQSGYRLGNFTSLAEIIKFYEGSFERVSLAAKPGGSVASVFSSIQADPIECRANESPLVCELRVHRPAIMFVMFGTNDVKTSSRGGFETHLKNLLDIAIQSNVVPVLVTKADNIEGDNSMNAIIVSVANEYELPVLNLWRAMQNLPDGGLQEDGIHLTYAQPYFDLPENMQKGWPVRNLVTLQMLEFLHNELEP